MCWPRLNVWTLPKIAKLESWLEVMCSMTLCAPDPTSALSHARSCASCSRGSRLRIRLIRSWITGCLPTSQWYCSSPSRIVWLGRSATTSAARKPRWWLMPHSPNVSAFTSAAMTRRPSRTLTRPSVMIWKCRGSSRPTGPFVTMTSSGPYVTISPAWRSVSSVSSGMS